MRVSRYVYLFNSKSRYAPILTFTRRPHLKQEQTTQELKSPITLSSSTFPSDSQDPLVQLPQQHPSDSSSPQLTSQQQLRSHQKSSTRVWRLKKYKNGDPEKLSSMVQNKVPELEDDTRQVTILTKTKNGTRKLPPRRPKIDKNGNPLEFLFVDSSPQQQLAQKLLLELLSSSQSSSPLAELPPSVAKKQGKFPKNIFRLSSGSKKLDSLPAPTPKLVQRLYSPVPSPTLKLSSSLQDLTRARNPSISSVGRSPLKRTYTSLLQQSRLAQEPDIGQVNKPRSDSSTSMLCIKIDDNGRAAVIQQPQLSHLTKTRSSSSSVSDLSSIRGGPLLSSRSKSPPLPNRSETSASPVFLSAMESSSTTPHSVVTDHDEDEDEDELEAHFTDQSLSHGHDSQENDAMIAFSKLMGPKRQQLSRKSSTISINSNFNNLTLNSATPIASPVLLRPLHQRSLSSFSLSASGGSSTRRLSPVRSGTRRLHHSHSISYIHHPTPSLASQATEASYYQSGINNNKQPLQPLPQLQLQLQPVWRPTLYNHPSNGLYHLNSYSDSSTRHNSNDSSTFDYQSNLGPSLDLTTSLTSASMTSVATPTSPELSRFDSNFPYQSTQQLHSLLLQKQLLHQQLQLLSINPYKILHCAELSPSKRTERPVHSTMMENLNSINSSATLDLSKTSQDKEREFDRAFEGISALQKLASPYQSHAVLSVKQAQSHEDLGSRVVEEFNNSILFNDSILSSYNTDDGEDNFDLFDFINYEHSNTSLTLNGH